MLKSALSNIHALSLWISWHMIAHNLLLGRWESIYSYRKWMLKGIGKQVDPNNL